MAILLQTGKAMVTGGCVSNSCSVTGVTEIHDPGTNPWTTTYHPLNTPRGFTPLRFSEAAKF